MNRFGILFGDSDFTHTFRSVISIMANTGLEFFSLLSKEELLDLLNATVFPIYLLTQNHSANIRKDEHYRLYLHLSLDNLLVDEEVTNYLKDYSRHCHHFHYVDTRGYFPNTVFTV